MKKIVLFICIVLAACSSRKEKSGIKPPQFGYHRDTLHRDPSKIPPYKHLAKFKGDTLKYTLKSFYDRRDYYIGKPLDSLLKDLEAPVKTFDRYTGRYVNQTVGISLILDDARTDSEKFNKKIASPTIFIDWKTPMKTDEISHLWRRSNRQWTDEVREYFRGKIVGDIVVTRKNFESK
jgi:hypothetical protein